MRLGGKTIQGVGLAVACPVSGGDDKIFILKLSELGANGVVGEIQGRGEVIHRPGLLAELI